jgi:hypothetical protein
MPQRTRGGQHVQQRPTMHASPIRPPIGTLAWTPRSLWHKRCQSDCAQSPSANTHCLLPLRHPLPRVSGSPLTRPWWPAANACQCCSLADCRPIGGDYIAGQHPSHGGDGTREEPTGRRPPVQIFVLSNHEIPDFLFRVLGNAPDSSSFVFEQ